MQQQDKVGHIRFIEIELCLLAEGKRGLLEAMAQIAFERLGCHTLQLQSATNLKETHFEAAGYGWWLYPRHAYEQRHYPQQHKKTPSPKRRRKKRRKRSKKLV